MGGYVAQRGLGRFGVVWYGSGSARQGTEVV